MINGLHTTNYEYLKGWYTRNNDDGLIFSDDELEISDDRLTTFQRGVAAFKYVKRRRSAEDAEDFAIVRITSNDFYDNDFYDIALSSAHKLKQLGFRPALRLEDGCAYEVQSEVQERFEQFLERPEFTISQKGYRTTRVIEILKEMVKQGYDIWIVGGAVRDLLRPEVDVAEVNDLDLAGTVPLGTMLRRLLRYRDRYGVTPKVSSGGVLWLYMTPECIDKEVIFQYAAIKSCVALERRAKNRQHWYSSDLKEDVRWRDLTFNSLFYDPFNHILLDPTRKGCEDLNYMRLTPIKPLEWPAQVTTVVVRILKFVNKYRNKKVDLDPALQMLLEILPDCYKELQQLSLNDRGHLLSKFYGSKSFVEDDPNLNKLSRSASLIGIAEIDEWNNVINVFRKYVEDVR